MCSYQLSVFVTLAAVCDPATGAVDFAVNSNLDEENCPLIGSNTSDSWFGNRSVGVGVKGSARNNAGSNDGTTASAFDYNQASFKALAGDLDRALFWNKTANIIPEPSTFVLAALGLLSLLGFRRRRRA